MEFVLDLPGLSGGLGLRPGVRIDRETAAGNALDYGELVPSAIAFRLRGIQLRKRDEAQ